MTTRFYSAAGNFPPARAGAQQLGYARRRGQRRPRARGDDQQEPPRHGRARRGRTGLDDRVQGQVQGAGWLGAPHRGQAAPEGGGSAVVALVTVQDGVAGEKREVGVRVTGAGGGVSAGEQVQDVEPVGGGEGHWPAWIPGRSQRWTWSWRRAGKMLRGMTACTALGGAEL